MIRNGLLLGFTWACHGLFLLSRLGPQDQVLPGWVRSWNGAIAEHTGLYLLTLGLAAGTVAVSTVVRFDELPTKLRWWWVPAVGAGAAGWLFQCFASYLHVSSDLG